MSDWRLVREQAEKEAIDAINTGDWETYDAEGIVQWLVLATQAEFDCEKASDTWRNCRESRDEPDEPYPRAQWCRSCSAKAALEEASVVQSPEPK